MALSVGAPKITPTHKHQNQGEPTQLATFA